MYQVFITGYRLVEVSYTKPYHVYTIEVLQPNSSLRHIVEKRYSEFNTLHRMLKKDTEDTAPFPPKRVRNSQLKVLEQRRSALESYMQKMLRLSSTKQQVLNFLGIENRAQNTNERMNGQVGIGDPKQVRSLTLRHHPILTFQCDPYIQANTTSSLPDIVTNGVLVGTLGFVIFWLTISWGFLWSINLLAMVGFAIGGPTAALSASFAVSLGELDGWKSGGAVVGVVSGFGGFGEVFERAVVTFVIETYGWNSMFILLTNLLCFSAFLVNRAHFATSNKLMNGRQYVI
ncbi:sorting nexin-24 isoform X6 [Neodiprion pinetum]|uniref:Sorting nexin-24 isoform X6 n=1 Tax=Neodiprion lecontei TaxID=441921 RepID=A0ABM3GD10_NEOLC|nr:sorting nexin-24-like isoform X6 [Neodiprion pinetum]XP_046598119.1 sorting nexin-24 isoform X6 [Neodiprion lecontei]